MPHRLQARWLPRTWPKRLSSKPLSAGAGCRMKDPRRTDYDAGNASSARAGHPRSEIVATAERLFRTLGYQKTTMADIAKELEMSSANVYRFFASKAELRDAVGRQLMGEVEGAVALIRRPTGARRRATCATPF